MAGWTGLEPATFCVTGRRSNQLSYHPVIALQILTNVLCVSKNTLYSHFLHVTLENERL